MSLQQQPIGTSVATAVESVRQTFYSDYNSDSFRNVKTSITMSHQNPEDQIYDLQSKTSQKIKPPPGYVDIWSTLKPTNEVIAHLKSIISEYELEVETVMDNIERSIASGKNVVGERNVMEQVVVTLHSKEVVSLLVNYIVEQLKLSFDFIGSEVVDLKERLNKQILNIETIEYAQAKNKIAFLLKLCGDNKSQKIMHLICESQKPFFVRKKDSLNIDKKESQDMQQNAEIDSPELLELQLKSLAAQLQISANIHKDYVQTLLKDKDVYIQQYKSDQERFETQINYLTNRLKETQENMLHLMHNLTTVQKRSKQKQIIWLYEKDKLVQELESCKEQLGKGKKLHFPTQNVLQMLQNRMDTLEKQISHRDKIITSYKTHCKELKLRLGSVKHQLDISHHEAKTCFSGRMVKHNKLGGDCGSVSGAPRHVLMEETTWQHNSPPESQMAVVSDIFFSVSTSDRITARINTTASKYTTTRININTTIGSNTDIYIGATNTDPGAVITTSKSSIIKVMMHAGVPNPVPAGTMAPAKPFVATHHFLTTAENDIFIRNGFNPK
uniref:Uncharacterized protein n=1 Tax=Timema tahoe TaxID=61484 RepID=A0A7R9IC98_9NEOP|nr:unnamed protein product [Timema tahoe]